VRVNETTASIRRGIAWACLTASLWGVLAIALKFTLRYVDAMTIVWFRFTLAFGALLAIMAWRRPRLTRAILTRPPPLALLGGFLLGVNYYAFLKGVDLTSPSNTQILIQLGPMLLIVSGIVVFGERLTRRQIIGYAIAAVGFAMFYRSQLSHLADSADDYNEGNLWIVAAAVSWVGYAVIQKMLVQRYEPQQLNLIIYVVPAMLFAIPAEQSALSNLSPGLWVLMVFLGLNTLIAYGALAEALKLAPVNIVSTIITLNPLITLSCMAVLEAMAVSWISPEPLTTISYLGAGVVLTGAILVVAQRASERVAAPSGTTEAIDS
jgi:drug/metabolite transporter (DMT)-like permease